MEQFERYSRDDNDTVQWREERELFFEKVGYATQAVAAPEPRSGANQSPVAEPRRGHELYRRDADGTQWLRAVGICPFCRLVIAESRGNAAGSLDSRGYAECQEISVRAVALADRLADALKTHVVAAHLDAVDDSRRPWLNSIENISLDSELTGETDSQPQTMDAYIQMLRHPSL